MGLMESLKFYLNFCYRNEGELIMYYQQGDVLFIPRNDAIPTDFKVKEDKIVAEGEATGHMHQVIDEDATVFVDKDGNIIVEASNGATVTHQEHHITTLPKGNYDIKIVREFDPLEDEIRNVRD